MPHVLNTPPEPSSPSAASGRYWAADLLFVLLAALYAVAAACGVPDMASGGADMDSDLSTYAFSMAGLAHPGAFVNDPVLRTLTPANSFWNLFQCVAGALTPGDAFAVGLFRAGALTIFLGLCSSYALGRWLFSSPGLAAVLSLLLSLTVWVGWGTFWGLTHSDPLPRTLYAALWPLLLLAGLAGAVRGPLRPAVMFCAGCGVWVHGLNGLAFGAMLFCAYALMKPASLRLAVHLRNLLLCLVCYFVPVLVFLRASLGQPGDFTAGDLAVFQELFRLRWAQDYTETVGAIPGYLWQYSLWPPLFPLAACGAWVAWRAGSERVRRLLRLYPGMLLGLACVVLFSWAESRFAAQYGRLSMGHELIRGMRYLIPLSWLLIVALVAPFWPRLPRLLRAVAVAGLACGIFLGNPDRQNVGAQHAVAQWTGLPLPHEARALLWRERSRLHREALEAVAHLVPPGERVYSNSGDMGVRHMALRPLDHTFKDGSHPFYNKDIGAARRWLRCEAYHRAGELGYAAAWRASDAPWLLTDRPRDREALRSLGEIVWENPGWLLLRRHPAGN